MPVGKNPCRNIGAHAAVSMVPSRPQWRWIPASYLLQTSSAWCQQVRHGEKQSCILSRGENHACHSCHDDLTMHDDGTTTARPPPPYVTGLGRPGSHLPTICIRKRSLPSGKASAQSILRYSTASVQKGGATLAVLLSLRLEKGTTRCSG